ncbi:MAG TPA: hypothetical protein VGR11_16425 [Solirubrobacteraceae bacterium]|nr:hypothetical protein [Solirubrobacteraceae bacterium]
MRDPVPSGTVSPGIHDGLELPVLTSPAPDARTRQDRCPGVVALQDAADGRLARVRVPGGHLTAEAMVTLAAAADELGNGLLDVTARANLQLRGLRAGAGGADMPAQPRS